ncbi:MAG: glycosyltransferase family 1 protein [Clostridia bacterium]|nr:glycosyltransferase family 1 protein [Clostridia bacterium]
MKVGIDARGAVKYRGTGIGTYTHQLIRHLKALEGEEYRLFWPGEEYRGLDLAGDEAFQLLELHRERYWEEVFIPHSLVRENIDIYHVPQNGLGLPKGKPCRYVVTIHDLIPYIFPETVGKGYLKEFLEQMPHIVEQADNIITVSNSSKDDLINLLDVPEDKISVIYEAPEPYYRPLPKEEAMTFVRENYGISNPFILYLGGFSPRKNLRVLINAYREIIANLDQPVELVMVGRESKEQKDAQMLAELTNLKRPVLWPGYVPTHQLPYFYNAAEVFVYPSLYEGFGLPPLEAMACGTPTVTTGVSSIPEVVGDAAVLVNPHDHLQLAQEIGRVLSNREMAHQYRIKGLARAARFNWLDTARATADVYRQVRAQ